jgi:peptide/nickel transport system permease protein
MARFIFQRLLTGLLVLLGATALSFFVIRVIPGDAVTTLLGGTPTTPEVEAQLRGQYHLDQPIVVQYGIYMRDLVQGDMGYSMRTHAPVWTEIRERLPSTVKLTALAFALALGGGLSLGILGSLLPRGPLERLLSIIQFAMVSMPSFWLGLILLTILSFRLGWFPATGDQGWKSLVLPAATMAIPTGSVIAQLLRDGMTSVLREQYITTARAKGLRELSVRRRHALRNALIPVITVSSVTVGSLLTGSVVIETVFARPGVGRLAVDSITNKDLPVVQGVVLLAATVFLLTNLIADILYALVDPRIR